MRDLVGNGTSSRSPADLTRRLWLVVLLSLALQVLYGGLRFNDGSSLAALAKDGFGAQLRPAFEYLLDSQLKVILLHTLGWQHPAAIGALFLVLSLAPLVVLPLLDRPLRPALLLFLSLIPLVRVLVQYVGVGDSVTVACALLIALSRSGPVTAAAGLVIVLWHFQQGAVMAAVTCAQLWIRRDAHDRSRALWLAAGLAVALAAHFAIKLTQVPHYTDRGSFVLEQLTELASMATFMLPVTMLVCLPVLYIHGMLRQPGQLARFEFAAFAAFAIVLPIAAITVDRSRVLLVMALPMMLLLLEPHLRNGRLIQTFLRWPFALPLVVLSAVMPLSANHALDVYLWPQLLDDLARWW